MTIRNQYPIRSGFDACSTAADVLQDQNLVGTYAIVTGGHSGIGLETTRALAATGARVIVPTRSMSTAQQALAGITGVEIRRMDLGDLESVEEFARHLVDSGQFVDMVICSAGIMASPETRVGSGWEVQFATNHLGHYALVNRLWPVLRPGARVVTVSSAGHHLSGMRWDDVQFEHGYDKWLAYGQSKTANVLFALALDERGLRDGVRAFAVHPGSIFTPLQRHLTQQEMRAAGWYDDPTFKTPQQGAATQVWAATAPELKDLGGVYCEDCDIAVVVDASAPTPNGVRPYAIDAVQAERLWALSAQLTGVDAFATTQSTSL